MKRSRECVGELESFMADLQQLIDESLEDGDTSFINWLLTVADPTRESIEVSIGLLTATSSMRSALPSWSQFRGRLLRSLPGGSADGAPGEIRTPDLWI